MNHPSQLPESADLSAYVEKIKQTQSFNKDSLCLLIDVFRKIRPDYYGNYQKAAKALNSLNNLLRADKRALHKFRYLVTTLIKDTEILEIFTESGIETDSNFLSELMRRLEYKVLPPQRKPESLLRVIDRIFYKNSDYRWARKIDNKLWIEFFSLLNLRADFTNPYILEKLNQSLHIVSCRIVTLCTDKEIKERLTKEELTHFIEQNRIAQKIMDFNIHSKVISEKYRMIEHDLIKELNFCSASIDRIQKQSATTGTSLQQTYLLKQIKQLIYRMKIILAISNRETPLDSKNTVDIFLNLIRNENVKHNITLLFRTNIRTLAYRVAEHEHDTGEHYITTTRKEYAEMFRSSMGGGVFAALMAIIKSFLHTIVMAPFWQGFAYSLNYAAGFVGIHITGSTLATKQPAMTASAIASAMDNKKTDTPSMSELSILISKVWRSQTASFVGNLSIAFPVALLIAFLYHLIVGKNIAEGIHAQELLDWQNPLRSRCLLYACHTGVFLYLSGLITGYVDNKVIHTNIPLRIKEHPFYTRYISQAQINKFADYMEANLGPIAGNVFLGFCLGMASFFGYIFGVEFDIRHITISTGQFAIGLQGLGYHVETFSLIMTIAGILMIGFLNFLVSFTLAFFTASISRGIKFGQYKHFFIYLRRLLVRYPLDFIFPPKRERVKGDLLNQKTPGS